MRTLVIDIETSPNVAHVWGLFNQTVSLAQLRESTQVIAFAAKWVEEKKTFFYSDHTHGHADMIAAAWALLDEADAVVHYNGRSFDIPHLRREFLLAGLTPPSPFAEIDLLDTVKKQFRFTSNKLDHVANQLGLGRKVQHEGHTLWVRCMAGEPRAWALMRKYNVHDVKLTEELYYLLKPWMKSHPTVSLYEVGAGCPRCGGVELQRRGYAYTKVSTYQRYQCVSCGAWSRGGKVVDRVDIR